MYLELLLLFSWIICFAISYHLKKTTILSSQLPFRLIIITSIIGPIIEECLFRYVLYDLTKNMIYYKELNAILFGLYHVQNVLIYTCKITVIQIIATSMLGYYLINLNNFLLSIGVHVLFNLSLTLVFKYWFNKKFDELKPFNILQSHYIVPGKLRRTKSMSDITKIHKSDSIIISNIRPDVLKSINKYNKKMNKKYKKKCVYSNN